MANRKGKTVYSQYIITEKGEMVSSRTIIKGQAEPEYVKLYIDCLFHVKGLRRGLSPIFLALLPYMSYADMAGDNGGQIIYINKALKKQIAAKLGVGLESINKALTEFVRAGICRRIDVGTYQISANIVGRGEWKDIKNIRAHFDFGAHEVVADVVKDGGSHNEK